MATLAFTRRGAGAPLVLLHALGLQRQCWDPVLPGLAEQFDVIAVDLPGFGESEPLPAEIEPHPAVLAASVARLLDDLGIARPHIVGNSLGGWIALELAAIQPVASLTLLSPAGLWHGRVPRYNGVSLRLSRWFTKHATALLSRLMAYRVARMLVLGQSHGRPARISPEYARMVVRALGTCPGFDATMRATEPSGYLPGPPFDAPVTVEFGSRDHVLLAASRRLDLLPPDTSVGTLPGCGHIPMADDPHAVIVFIREGVARGIGRLTR